MNKQHILVPLDDSAESRAILPIVCRLFDPGQYEVTVVRVVDQPAGVGLVPDPLLVDALVVASRYDTTVDRPPVAHPIYDIQVEEGVRATIDEGLRVAAEPLRAAGFRVATDVRFGDPAQEIVAASKELGIDLVAMTTHGRHGLRRVLLGSVAQHVMRRLELPVLVFRPAELADAWPTTHGEDMRLPR